MSPKGGPGYASPLDAMKNGPREKILYVCCVQPNQAPDKTDLLATVDVDPDSPTYQQIIHRMPTGRMNDELHHSGWNVCSSCHESTGCCNAPDRDKLLLPCLGSNRVIVVDVGENPRAPKIYKSIEADELYGVNCATPHTTHCLATGEIMISVMGDPDENGKGDFVLIDGKTFKVKGTFTKGKLAKFGYDFWYQPYHDVMISTEWGVPRYFKKGFEPWQVNDPDVYGRSLNFYKWSTHELIQTINLGDDGIAPLEVRFLHDPKAAEGYVGCAVSSTIFRFYKGEDNQWKAKKVITVPPKKVEGWPTPYINGLISDILISLDDKYLYLNNWLHGDVRQYDITDRNNPKLTGQVFLGGQLLSDSPIKVLEDPELDARPDPVHIKGKRLHAGPQMMQLSLDGKRLYVSNSLFSPWDKQFYPDSPKNGGYIVKIDCDTKKGGMKLDTDFVVDFGKGPDGPVLAHEMRYPGGDCTSDIWMAID